MWWRKRQIGPEPTEQADPREVLLDDLRKIRGELAALDREALALIQKYELRFGRFGQIVGMKAGLADRAKVEVMWRDLDQRTVCVIRGFHATNTALGELKISEERRGWKNQWALQS